MSQSEDGALERIHTIATRWRRDEVWGDQAMGEVAEVLEAAGYLVAVEPEPPAPEPTPGGRTPRAPAAEVVRGGAAAVQGATGAVKPVTSEAWLVVAETDRGKAYLCGMTMIGRTVTTDLGRAHRFITREDADEARSRFEEQHHGSGRGPSRWKVVQAVTRTTFREG